MYKDILDRINLPVFLWKINENNELICIFSNNQNSLKEGDMLKTFMKKNKIGYMDSYKKILENGEEQTINLNDNHIILTKITDNIYSEVHYPKCDDLYILYSISNKLRSPLTNIIGITSIIDELKLSEQNRQYMNIIKSSSYDIVSVANDIVDMVNLKTNKIKLKHEKTSLDTIAKDVYKIIANDIKKKGLKFNVKLDDKLPDIITVDISRLVQITVKIIGNSLKFTSDGAINLEISLFNTQYSHDCPFVPIIIPNNKYNILFMIKDTGDGIDEDRKKIINKVLNIKQSEDIKSYKNTGFGLLICRDLCALMGGSIWYKSEEDMGSVFYFTIVCDGIKLD